MKDITENNWKLEKDTLVIVHSNSCPNCAIALDHITNYKVDGVKIKLLDFDSEINLCDNVFEIFEVPSYLYLKNGEIAGRLFGLQEPLSVKGFAKIHKNENYN